MSPDDRALCIGQWDLFDSCDPADHRVAASFCRQCPMLLDCRKLLEETSTDWRAKHGGPQGTWAGILLRGRSGDVALTMVCPICDTRFTPRSGAYRYCSPTCSAAGREASYRRHQARRPSRAGEGAVA